MSEAHMKAYLNYYNSLNAAPTGGGGKGNQKDDEDEGAYDSLLKDAQKRIVKGESAEVINAEIARKVADGELDAETAQKIIIAVTQAQFG